ncbi:zinc ribbon domain-containing protein [Calidithermus chliarophilus]|uniref:zinc ribbon domain-containing protein n=1 Tax=Calidithermus chliarophilus TaxID=52023 RepID=UPI0004011487|nr:C4-type zinc ribbon domain-containing protein [Calidithermus chliarophilus]
MNGSDALAELFRLQEKDLELDRIREEQGNIPEDLKAARARWQSLEAELAKHQGDLREQEMEYRQNEAEIADLKEKLGRAKEAQRQAQGAREQTQYENVIQQLTGRYEELEGLNEPKFEEISRLEGEVERVKALLAEAKPKLEELEAANAARVEALEASYQSKLAERNALAATIPANLVKEYEAVRKSRKGQGVAKVARTGSGYRCMGCNVQLPMNIAQKVYQGNQIVRCPSCGRIMWKGE